jgi:hypothetical protein
MTASLYQSGSVALPGFFKSASAFESNSCQLDGGEAGAVTKFSMADLEAEGCDFCCGFGSAHPSERHMLR